MAMNQQTKDLLAMVKAGIEQISAATLRGLETTVTPLDNKAARQNVAEKAISDRLTFGATETPEIPENELLQQLDQLATEKMTGAVPQDVQDEINRITAEMSVQGGVAPSQFASNITAQALGLTSLEIQNQGADLGLRVAQGQVAEQQVMAQNALGWEQLRTNQKMFDEDMNLKWAALNEQNLEWDQKLDVMQQELALNERALELQGLKLIADVTLGMDRIMADMIINDSLAEIPYLGDTLETFGTSANDLNDYIMSFIGG